MAEHDSRAQYVFSLFDRIVDSTDGRLKYRCKVELPKNHSIQSSNNSTVNTCKRLFRTTKSTNLAKHLRSQRKKSSNQILDHFDANLSAAREKRAAENVIILRPGHAPAASSRASKQSLMTSHFQQNQTSTVEIRDELSRDIAVMFAHHDLAVNFAPNAHLQLVLDLYVQAVNQRAVIKFDSCDRINHYQKKMADEFKEEICNVLRESGCPITLAYSMTDGMTRQGCTCKTSSR